MTAAFSLVTSPPLVVTGGRKGRTLGLLHIQDGDLLEAFLRPTTEITPTQADDSDNNVDSEDGDNDSDSDDSESDFADPLPDSSDFPTPSPPRGPGPHGPPPPSPVNRNRGRSPPARVNLGSARHATLYLADLLDQPRPPEQYSLTATTIQLPHKNFDPMCIYRPWAPAWMSFDLGAVALLSCVEVALKTMWPWTSILEMGSSCEELHLHLFSDGSWNDKTQCGGYAVVLLPERCGKCAFFGAVCAPGRMRARLP